MELRLKPGMKTGVENNISVWSEIGSGFGKPGGKPQQELPGVPAREKVKTHTSQKPKRPELIPVSLT